MANVKRKNAAVNESKRPAAQIEAANDNASRAVLLKQERAALPRSTHEGVVRFGEIEADGFVLENGTACLSRRGVLRLLTGREDGTGDLGKLSRSLWKTLGNLPQPNLAQNGTLPQKNSGGLPQPNLAFLRFTAADGSAVVDGLDADSIVDLFQLYVKALEKGVLRADQIPLATPRCAIADDQRRSEHDERKDERAHDFVASRSSLCRAASTSQRCRGSSARAASIRASNSCG